MISNVSFAGKLFATGNIPNLAKRGEMFQLKEAAKESDFDVVLLQRDYYSDGTGVYDALIVKTDKHNIVMITVKVRIIFFITLIPNKSTINCFQIQLLPQLLGQKHELRLDYTL